MARRTESDANRHVLGFGGPNARAGTRDGRSALRLHGGIAIVAFVLCAFVSGVFYEYGRHR